ncbi:hypothetical protein CO675_39335 [Bradyrhizobium sp. C9]|nr:hypothetical protein CO675_39335 [Bradyrhizobium sp. C9]
MADAPSKLTALARPAGAVFFETVQMRQRQMRRKTSEPAIQHMRIGVGRETNSMVMFLLAPSGRR